MRIVKLGLLGALLPWGCGGEPDKKTPPIKTSPSTMLGTEDEAPEWARGKPSIDGGYLLPGAPAQLTLDGVPNGGIVTWLRSDVGTHEGMGGGQCLDLWETVCTELVDAYVVDAGIGGSEGAAVMDAWTPEDSEPHTVWFQAWVLDLDTGASALSSVLERHVAVPSEAADLVMVSSNDEAGLGPIVTGGNSHTGGVAWVDINGDYLPDLFVTNSTDKPHYLFLNRGGGYFQDVSERVPKGDDVFESAGVMYADIDNDGDQDILVVTDSQAQMTVVVSQSPAGGPNLLYINDGYGFFTEQALEWGVLDPNSHRTACGAFGDYDRDGWIDLYLCKWAVLAEPLGVHDNYDQLMINDGTRFVHRDTEVDGHGLDALVAAFIDFDGDLWPDLYVGNVAEHDSLPNENPRDVLYRNTDGIFDDVTEDGMGQGYDAWAAMGTALGDIDNDGVWEFYITDHWDYPSEPRGNPLYTVLPDGRLSENICREAGICTGYLSWPANFADFNLDGFVDLWVGTAFSSHADLMFINAGDGTFVLHEQEGFKDNASHGGAVADFDADGDLDVFIFADQVGSHLYRNDLKMDAGWLQIHLEGTDSNRSAIGAVVRATAGGETMMRMVRGGDSAHSQSQAAVHFGLADAVEVDVEITWPSGTVQSVGLLAKNAFFIVDETDGIRVEDLSDEIVLLNGTDDMLHIEVHSNYGGRTNLQAQPLGLPLQYDATTGMHTLDVQMNQYAPTEIVLISERGGEWSYPI